MRRLGQIVLDSWELKVASALMACAVWALVLSHQTASRTVVSSVEYVGLGGDLALVESRPERVAVEVEAPRWVMARLDPHDLRALVNVTGLPPGESRVTLRPEQVQVPPGVRVVRVAPVRLQIVLARDALATMTVRARVRGQPAPGYRVERVSVAPETVMVKGPQSTIETQTAIDTQSIDVSGSHADVIRTVGLVVPGSLNVVKDSTVRVQVKIGKQGQAQ